MKGKTLQSSPSQKPPGNENSKENIHNEYEAYQVGTSTQNPVPDTPQSELSSETTTAIQSNTYATPKPLAAVPLKNAKKIDVIEEYRRRTSEKDSLNLVVVGEFSQEYKLN
jgi:hypothetical protein